MGGPDGDGSLPVVRSVMFHSVRDYPYIILLGYTIENVP